MTRDEAKRIVGNQPQACIKAMAIALSLVTYRNTPDEWQRLEAAVIHLGPACPRRARRVLRAHWAALRDARNAALRGEG
jgi:hypothetical protein